MAAWGCLGQKGKGHPHQPMHSPPYDHGHRRTIRHPSTHAPHASSPSVWAGSIKFITCMHKIGNGNPPSFPPLNLQVAGTVDQSGSMLSEEIANKGYALLCVATPTSDCKIQTIAEDELLEQQFGV